MVSNVMVWNGVHFNTYTVIPWPVMASLIAIYIGSIIAYWTINPKNKRPMLTTRDMTYMGLVAAMLVVYNYFIAPLVPSISVLDDFFQLSMIGDIYMLLLVAALVSKPGSVGITVIMFDLLGDITHYGFGGEPFWIIGDVIAYAMIIDLWLIFRRGNFMSSHIKKSIMPFMDGIMGGIAYAVSVPLFFMGFWGSFVHGFIFNYHFVLFRVVLSIPEGIIFGIIVTPLVIYTRTALKK
jgi:hypothetical protein